ncbi:hypothetical protein DERP_008949 [Dermatophagoides pteronyssinus]|uniref:Uncharacterized protein n=1 Tax=Dermatophagoides pteronyssinus TaxID=6956 RepID=A0ABQ8JNB1_DERPT|nr:hypothetical protein DERP_008949 [Dermatophagoides pteronyssinus]
MNFYCSALKCCYSIDRMPSSTSFNNNDEPWRKLLFKQVESIKSLFILLFYLNILNKSTNQPTFNRE